MDRFFIKRSRLHSRNQKDKKGIAQSGNPGGNDLIGTLTRAFVAVFGHRFHQEKVLVFKELHQTYTGRIGLSICLLLQGILIDGKKHLIVGCKRVGRNVLRIVTLSVGDGIADDTVSRVLACFNKHFRKFNAQADHAQLQVGTRNVNYFRPVADITKAQEADGLPALEGKAAIDIRHTTLTAIVDYNINKSQRLQRSRIVHPAGNGVELGRKQQWQQQKNPRQDGTGKFVSHTQVFSVCNRYQPDQHLTMKKFSGKVNKSVKNAN